jgi:hypothetical protein
MADKTINIAPLGKDAIKGSIFFGSNLTPSGSFSNIPQTYTYTPPTPGQENKVKLTLESLKQQLNAAAQIQNNVTTDPLTEANVNSFLTNFVQLLVDYRDLRNFVFYGSSYTELAYNITYLINNFPYKSYIAKPADADLLTINILSNTNQSELIFSSIDILNPSIFIYKETGPTTWPDYEIIDNIGQRFPIVSIETPIKTLIHSAVYDAGSSTTKITTAVNHNFVDRTKIEISNILGNDDTNGIWFVKTILGHLDEFLIYQDPDLTNPVLSSLSCTIDTGGVRQYPYQYGGTYQIKLTVNGILNINNIIDSNSYRGFLVTPTIQDVVAFEINLTPLQQMLLSLANPTPWPRETPTQNIIIDGSAFDDWLSDPKNLYLGSTQSDDFEVYTDLQLELNLLRAGTLDETETNRLIKKGVPYRLVDELNDAEGSYTRFVLLAAKMFDTIKVYIEFLKYVKQLNYTSFNQLSPEFYHLYAEHYGFDLFDEDNIDFAKSIIRTEPGLQYDNNFTPTFSNQATAKTLKQLQFEKQKRLLLNLFYLYQIKGTQACVKFLTSLLGSPDGLIVLKEYAFDVLEKTPEGYPKHYFNNSIPYSGKKITDNQKIYAPKFTFEIDPAYLVVPDNINNPLNLPYVYKIRLENQETHNLREISINADGQNPIANEIIKYGTNTYTYGNFSSGAYANLQDVDLNNGISSYYFLPLTFPDRFCGIITDYNIPKGGFYRGIGNNTNEVSVHIASLYQIEDLTTSFSTAPLSITGVTATSPVEIFTTSAHGYSTGDLVKIFNLTATDPESIWRVTSTGASSFTLNNSISNTNYVPGGTVRKISGVIPVTKPYRSSYTLGPDIPACGRFQILSGSVSGVISITIESVTIGSATWESGDNAESFTVKLINNINKTPLQTGIKYWAYSGESGIVVVKADNFTGVYKNGNSINISTTDIVVGDIRNMQNGTNTDDTAYIITRLEDKDLVVRAKIVDENDTTKIIYRVAVYSNYFNDDGLNHKLKLIYRPKGVEVYKDFENLGIIPWLDPTTHPSTAYHSSNVPKSDFSLLSVALIPASGNNSYFASPNKTGLDQPHWWDLFIGIPKGINIYFKSLEVFELNAVNEMIMSDASQIHTEESYIFNFSNNLVGDHSSLNIPGIFQLPEPPASEDKTWYYLPTGLSNIVNNLKLSSKTHIHCFTELPEQYQAIGLVQAQDYFNNAISQTDIDLFRSNAWSPTLHKDYDYDNTANAVFNNYEIYASQILTYEALLPFIKLIEDKFRKLVTQFIPIVINISSFGQTIRNNSFNEKKIKYKGIHTTCFGTYESSLAVAEFTVNYGTYIPTTTQVVHITCIADVANSIDGKFFYISSTTTDYYVWIKTNTGSSVDPSILGRTGIEVLITTNSTAHTIALAVADALNTLGGVGVIFSAPTPGAAIITVTNATSGQVHSAPTDVSTSFIITSNICGISLLIPGLNIWPVIKWTSSNIITAQNIVAAFNHEAWTVRGYASSDIFATAYKNIITISVKPEFYELNHLTNQLSGTVTWITSSTTINGSGTKFIDECRIGGKIKVGTDISTIIAINSNIQLIVSTTPLSSHFVSTYFGGIDINSQIMSVYLSGGYRISNLHGFSGGVYQQTNQSCFTISRSVPVPNLPAEAENIFFEKEQTNRQLFIYKESESAASLYIKFESE